MERTYETKELETERLVLQRGELNDYLAVYEYEFDDQKRFGGEFIYQKRNPSLIKNWYEYECELLAKGDERSRAFDWIVYSKETMEPMGNIFAEDEDKRVNSIRLDFNLHPKYWGNGYMPEALNGAVNHLFETGYDYVNINYFGKNTNAARVANKLGFQIYDIIDIARYDHCDPILQYETVMTREKWLEKKHSKVMKLVK